MKQTRRKFMKLASSAAVMPFLSGTEVDAAARAREKDVPMAQKEGFRIHPAIGIARLGDSGAGLANPFIKPDTFYLAPTTTGGLPTEYDAQDPGRAAPVESFKDKAGRVRRQAARFQVFREDGKGGSIPISLVDPDIESIRWTVHVANKKPAWYGFSEYQGNLMLGPQNSYERQGVPVRNAKLKAETDRQKKLIIDPGPRTVSGPGEVAAFDDPDRYHHQEVREVYPLVSFSGPKGISKELGFKNNDLYPYPLVTLGHMTMDKTGGLLFLGGHGRVGGPKEASISSFTGADGFYDDISDGPVTAHITFTSGESLSLFAWVVAAPPKFAPELVNITNLDDINYDTAVRHKGAAPEIFDLETQRWNPDFIVNFDEYIRPMFERMRAYQWVADVAPMVAYATPRFDVSDNSDKNRAARERWFAYLREPASGVAWEFSTDHNEAFAGDGFPMMPQNSGSNSVTNTLISKFVSLSPTQYFFFSQWAKGKFEINGPRRTRFSPHPLDRASVGNFVGAPMAPGIEVTWSMRNPAIYMDDDPYRIRVRTDGDYTKNGLSPARDETQGGGCEPGDLTKRMAIPWQADLFDCAAQPVSFRDPLVNQNPERSLANFDDNIAGHIPPPPTFNAHWWPPQSPVRVYSGADSAEQQTLDGGIGLGEMAPYQRGVNTFIQTILAWKYLGFVVNTNSAEDRDDYPYFVETERNYSMFRTAEVGFTPDGTLEANVPTRTSTSSNLEAETRPLHYYAGPK